MDIRPAHWRAARRAGRVLPGLRGHRLGDRLHPVLLADRAHPDGSRSHRRHGRPLPSVRHPAYLGAVLLGFSLGMLLGSWWAFLIGLVDSLLLVLRTGLEDRDLQRELPGYPEYARRVPYRLLPGIW